MARFNSIKDLELAEELKGKLLLDVRPDTYQPVPIDLCWHLLAIIVALFIEVFIQSKFMIVSIGIIVVSELCFALDMYLKRTVNPIKKFQIYNGYLVLTHDGVKSIFDLDSRANFIIKREPSRDSKQGGYIHASTRNPHDDKVIFMHVLGYYNDPDALLVNIRKIIPQ